MNDFVPHWRDDLSNEQYHAIREFYSSSNLKPAVEEDMESFITAIRNPKSKVETDAMRLGTIIHSAILEGDDFIKRYIVQPDFSAFGHANSNAHKAAKAEWKAQNQNKIIVTQDNVTMLEGIYESLTRHPEAMTLLKGCLYERSGFYLDPETKLPLRIRYDAYDKNCGILIDLKSTTSVKKEDFARSIVNYRYDVSMSMYAQGIKEIDGSGPDDMVFITVKKEPPYSCAVYFMSPRAKEIGLSDYRLALRKIADCQKSGVWPPYQSQIEEIDLPTWFKGRSE